MKITEALREIGKKEPELLLEKFELLKLTEKQFKIMKLRYIDGLYFKQIEIDLEFSCQRWMYQLHKKALNTALSNHKFKKWLHNKSTTKSLYVLGFFGILKSAGNCACNIFRRLKNERINR